MKGYKMTIDMKNLADLRNKLEKLAIRYYKDSFFFKVQNRFYYIDCGKSTFKKICELKAENARFFNGFSEYAIFKVEIYNFAESSFNFLNLAIDKLYYEYLQNSVYIDFAKESIRCIAEQENIESSVLNEILDSISENYTPQYDNAFSVNLESIESKSTKIQKARAITPKAKRVKVKKAKALRKKLKSKIIKVLSKKLHSKFANKTKMLERKERKRLHKIRTMLERKYRQEALTKKLEQERILQRQREKEMAKNLKAKEKRKELERQGLEAWQEFKNAVLGNKDSKNSNVA